MKVLRVQHKQRKKEGRREKAAREGQNATKQTSSRRPTRSENGLAFLN